MTIEEKLIIQLHHHLIDNKVNINDLKSDHYMGLINSMYNFIINGGGSLESIYAFLMICQDYYVYSEDGDVLIYDPEYNKVMSRYMDMGGKQIIYADYLGDNVWKMIEHPAPFMVGSVAKVYDYHELDKYVEYIKTVYHNPPIVLAPKFDGVSSCVGIDMRSVDWGITRGNGITGQDITEVVRRIPNLIDIANVSKDGYLKIEMLMSRASFKMVQEIKGYKNRRSAVTGIINTPKNLDLAQYLTAIPLCWVSKDRTEMDYCAPGSITMREYYVNSKDKDTNILHQIKKMLKVIRDPNYPFRVDGVVLFPLIRQDEYRFDVMKDAIAYKINTNKAMTRVIDVYGSIGRTGVLTPIANVELCDVNETEVSNVSLSNANKFRMMDLHYGETAFVESAGDVIPMLSLPSPKEYPKNSERIPYPTRCADCKYPDNTEWVGKELYCLNEKCPRILAGRITNFLEKIGVENISDATVETLIRELDIKSITDMFDISTNDIAVIPGFGHVSANNITTELARIKQTPIEVSRFFGSLGIENISLKKCRRIFEEVSLDEVLNDKPKRLFDKILDIHGFNMTTVKIFTNFIKDNRDFIIELKSLLNIIPDKHYKGNIVFTGFRNKEWKEKFDLINIEVSENINSKTLAVVYLDEKTPKYKTAREKNIPLFPHKHLEELYQRLSVLEENEDLN